MSEPSPVRDLDQVRRMRVMSEAVRGTTYAEAYLEQPFASVWAIVGDLERELPRLLPDIRTLRILTPHGERMRALATGYLGQRALFEVVLRPGWCWMQSRFLVGGLAVTADGGGTRFAFVGGFRFPGFAPLHPLAARAGRPCGWWVIRRLRRRLAAVSAAPAAREIDSRGNAAPD